MLFLLNVLKFIKANHPVIAVLGDPSTSLNWVLEQLESQELELEVFDLLNKDLLKKIDEFLLLFAKRIKVAVCIINSGNQSLVSSMLKRVEDVPEKTFFILLAPNFPETILNRCVLLNYAPFRQQIPQIKKILDKWDGFSEPDLPDQLVQESSEGNKIMEKEKIAKGILVWFEKKLIDHYMSEKVITSFKIGYETWKKLVEIEFWLDSKQITATSAVEMILSVIAASGFIRKKR